MHKVNFLVLVSTLSILFLAACNNPVSVDSGNSLVTSENAQYASTSTGTVNVTLLGDRVDNGVLVSFPLSNVGVYLGDWHAGNILGYTDANGKVTVTVPSGDQEFSFFKMTSSHSVMQSYGNKFNVAAGATISKTFHIAPDQVSINAYYDCGYGYALYLTGQTGYLGNWSTAKKLTYNSSTKCWSFYGNLPLGAEYKVVKAKWVDAASISTAGVVWEKGANHKINPISGYYESVNNIYPAF